MPPGGRLTRANPTPLPPSRYITGAQWLSGRYDPPSNQWGDILPTVWSDDGSTYVLMDDGGVDVPLAGGFWRQSFAKITGIPPNLHFKRVATASTPAPTTWTKVGGNPDNDDGPLGPFYSIGFAEAGGVFYATQQENWNWGANGPFNGLAGIAYSTDHGKTWMFPARGFPPPLGNLTFVDGGGPGGAYPDGYMYAIGTEREFNASGMVLGRVQTGVANVTDPTKWQWYAGSANGVPQWSSSATAATPVLKWNSHITYPEMTYDAGLHRYLLTFTYSYSSNVPAVWNGGAELIVAESPTPWGPFSFVASSREFGPSNGYGAGLPSQWISANGRTLWLKWAANFDGCAKGLDCSGKYGFNVAKVQLTVAPPAKKPPAKKTAQPKAHKTDKVRTVAVVSGTALPLLLIGLVGWRSNWFRRRRD
ncbi:MAG: DUF4185 domain-containing protein [Solirubrobacterales bacterium]|nr:DUF4185 domain-containing protein [Solirubrobacterales bacterium]